MSIFEILMLVATVLGNLGPYLLQAEQALMTGGLQGLLSYLESLFNINPPGLRVKRLQDLVAEIKGRMEELIAAK